MAVRITRLNNLEIARAIWCKAGSESWCTKTRWRRLTSHVIVITEKPAIHQRRQRQIQGSVIDDCAREQLAQEAELRLCSSHSSGVRVSAPRCGVQPTGRDDVTFGSDLERKAGNLISIWQLSTDESRRRLSVLTITEVIKKRDSKPDVHPSAQMERAQRFQGSTYQLSGALK